MSKSRQAKTPPAATPVTSSKRTTPVRLRPDIRDLVTAVCRGRGITNAEFFDDVIGQFVLDAYQQLRPRLAAMAAESDAAAEKLATADAAAASYRARARKPAR